MSESVTCEICGKKFNGKKGLVAHIRQFEKIDLKDYYHKYLKKENEEFCKKCGKEKKFYGLRDGYRDYCSTKCMKNDEEINNKIRQTNIERYGTKTFIECKKGKEKIKNTILERYGVENAAKNDYIKEKSKNIINEKYGCHHTKLKETQEKKKQTVREKYGVDVTTQNKDVLEKRRNNLIKKYGGPSVLYDPKIKEKLRQTNLLKYNVENVFQNKKIQEKCKKTNLERYGVENYSSSMEERKRRYKKIINSERVREFVIPLFDIEDYTVATEYYDWKCKQCGNMFTDHLDQVRIPRCPNCYPIRGSSKYEEELTNFIKSFYYGKIRKNDRKILKNINRELDIYIPEKNLAIEFNGLYWHSELKGKNSNYHLDKTLECEKQNIKLIHIFEDEWIEKQDIIKSIIKNKMGFISNRISARKCKIKKLDNYEASEFLNNNHIQGHIPGKYYGLFYNEKLVQVCGIGKSRFNKKYDWEILRICSVLETVVNGGLSKLLNHIMKENKGSYITYSDIRYGDGNGYLKCGFEYKGRSTPNYFYVDQNFTRHSRNRFQKHKLKNILEYYDPDLSEWENMQLNLYDRIWDCGNNSYIWRPVGN